MVTLLFPLENSKMAISTRVFCSSRSALGLLFSLLMMLPSDAVDRGRFKTCDQSAFCRRQRAIEPNQSQYVILMDSLVVQKTEVRVQVTNVETNVRLLVRLFNLRGGHMVRLKIDEVSPIKPRYEVPPELTLNGELLLDSVSIGSRDNNGITLKFGANKVVLTQKPFRLDVVADDNEPVISFNAQGLFNFEHLRVREFTQQDQATGSETPKPTEEKSEEAPQANEPQAADEGEVDKNKANEEKDEKEEEKKKNTEDEGMWSETFGSHTDTKPNGPTSIGIDVSFPGFEHVYGIPEHAESLALKSTKDTEPYRLYNLDVFEYELHNPMALYGSVPFMTAHNKERTVGVVWLNAAEMWIDVRSNIADRTFLSKLATFVKGDSDIPQVDTHWIAESGIVDLFFLLGPKPTDVLQQYATLSGATPIPPLFAISYHQCRWNYNDQDDVLTVDSKFDEHDIPYDVIWLDIEHTDGKRYMTWDKTKFPDSLAMLERLNQKGRKLVNVVDPHLKHDDDFALYSDAKSRDLFVKDSSNANYDGWCWSGSSCWPDFTDPVCQKWWQNQFAFDKYTGTAANLFVWNDMNEPSVFNGPEGTMHKDNIHCGGWEHRDVHNLYALAYHAATFLGLKERTEPPMRPFVLTRGFFIGSQKYGAVWTGDNLADWPHLKMSIPMMLSLSLAGISFSGADIAGFFKNPDTELLTRWYQAGSYQPFFRAHAHIDTRRREPWLQPEANMIIIRETLKARYALLPYWYTLFYHNERTGVPPMRPMWLEYPRDENVFSMDDQYMLGSALLIKPIVESGSTGTNVYFPGVAEVWYDVDTYETYDGSQNIYVRAGLDKIPVFQRGGTIIPRKLRQRRSSALTYNDPFTLFICLDKQNKASGDLYVDDYSSYNYKSGQYIHKQFTFDNNVIRSSNVDTNNKFATVAWLERIVVVGVTRSPTAVSITSHSIQGQQSLAFSFRAELHLLVIRKPGIKIGDDWLISMH